MISNKKTNNHIEEYFSDNKESQEERASRQIFKGDTDVDLRTDLSHQEIRYLNTMILNDNFLKSRNYKPLFKMFYEPYFRLKISLDRKSRGEFVKINSRDNTEHMVEGMKTAGTLFSGK